MKKVLIVDDTKNIRILLTTCLELRNYEVITACNGETALNILAENKKSIDLIFLDIRMPEMNGTEVLKSIREMGIKCPVIIMTAFATVKNAVDCTRLGAAAYLQKPFSPDRVNAVLDEIFISETKDDNLLDEEKDENLLIKQARILIDEGNYEEAHGKLKEALAINPYKKDIYTLIGDVNNNINNEAEAKRFYEISKLFNE